MNLTRAVKSFFRLRRWLLALVPLLAHAGDPGAAKVGVAYAADFAVTGVPKSASSYAVTGLPPGLFVVGASFSAETNTYLLSRPFGVIAGAPTAAGDFTLSVTAWELPDRSGPSRTFAYTIAVSPAPPSAPVITLQPVARTVAAGGVVVFSAAASGTPAPTYQWEKDGQAIPGAVGSEYIIANCVPTDAGTYSVTAINLVGAATSSSVLLTVIVPPSAAVIAIVVEP